MTNHLKRIAAPKSWLLDRGFRAFTVKPNPGAHALENGLALGMILRDKLHYAATMNEVRKLLQAKEVLVDGVRRKDHRFNVGLLDVLSIPELQKHFRVVLDNKARLTLKEIQVSESAVKLCKVLGKTTLPGGKIQYNLYDGKNIVATQKANTGDTLVLALPSLEVKEVLPLKVGASVYLVQGKRGGDVGELKELQGIEATYIVNGKEVETLKAYLFVVGSSKGVDITLK